MYDNTIFLAEDDPTDARFFQRALNNLDSPPDLIWRQTGQEAYETLMHGRPGHLPRLAILDIKMPGMNGLELLRELKANDRTSKLPVIIMSSSDAPSDISRAYAEGANGYLVKPTRFRDLKELVSSIDYFWIKTNRLSHGARLIN